MDNAPPGIDYAVVIADLRKRIEDMQRAVAILEALHGSGALGASAASGNGGSGSGEGTAAAALAGQSTLKEGAPIPSDAFFGMSISNAAQKYMNMRKKPATTPEIAEALEQGGFPHQSGNFANTIHSVLTRNSAGTAPIFAKVKRGVWGLRAWYPNFRPKDDD